MVRIVFFNMKLSLVAIQHVYERERWDYKCVHKDSHLQIKFTREMTFMSIKLQYFYIKYQFFLYTFIVNISIYNNI